MSEVGADIPAQRADSGDTMDISAATTATASGGSAPAGTTFDRVQSAAGEAAGKVTDFASDTAGKVGSYASDTAGKVGAYASDTADKVGALAGETADKVGAFASEAADKVGHAVDKAVDRIRNNAELAAERGTTTIANEVVEKIAGIAARKVQGVYDLGGDVARVVTAVRERVGLGDGEADQGVSVVLSGTQAAVKLVLVIEYGHVVYTITEQVRTEVIAAVEHLLGLEVTAVDIVVDDVHVSEAAPVA